MKAKTIGFYVLLGLVLLIAPFYTGPSIGGSGLRLPFNISIWFVIPWFLLAAILIILRTKIVHLPQHWRLFLPLFILMFISGMLSNSEPIAWLFRLSFIFGGGLFLLALFQYKPRENQINVVLFGLLLAMFFHGLIAVVQTQFPNYLPLWLPPSPNGVPYGIFQQINIQASYMVTSLIVLTYLISRPCFLTSGMLLKIAMLAVVATSSYVIFASGSRIGLLALFLSLPLLVIARRQQLVKHKGFLLVALLVMNANAWYQQAGISQSLAKTTNLTQGEYKAARLGMYTIGTELVLQKPFLGHGIGSFQQVWAQQAGDFHRRFPEAILPDVIITTHPHNEFLYWLIEAGSVVVLGILLVILAVGLAIYRCGFSRGGAYLAMLLPITLHTQVELPFYGSSAHWFTWLLLLFLPLRHTVVNYGMHLSRYATALLYTVSLSLAVLVSSFMVHTFRAQSDIFRFLYTKSEPPYLQVAMHNIYFKPLAIELAMRSNLYEGIKRQDETFVRAFIEWSNDMGEARSMLIYEDLVKAYDYLQYVDVECALVKVGAEIYPNNKNLSGAYVHCLEVN